MLKRVFCFLPQVFFSSYYQGIPDVCFIHAVYDFIPERTEMNDRGTNNGQIGPNSEYWPRVDNLRHAGGFLSISKSTTDDLCELYGMCDTSIVSTSDNRAAPIFKPAADAEVKRLKARLGIHKPFFLCVGKRYGYKNYEIMWEGLAMMPREFRDKYMVVLVGKRETQRRGIEVKAVQGVSEADLPTLYTAAAAFVYPSKYEGFGMPPVEAAACGTPLILGPFHRDRMHHVFGDLAQYATTGPEMARAFANVAAGIVAQKKALVQRASLWGPDPRHGWNEVARDYLEYMIHGPFRSHTSGGRMCRPLVPVSCCNSSVFVALATYTPAMRTCA